MQRRPWFFQGIHLPGQRAAAEMDEVCGGGGGGSVTTRELLVLLIFLYLHKSLVKKNPNGAAH